MAELSDEAAPPVAVAAADESEPIWEEAADSIELKMEEAAEPAAPVVGRAVPTWEVREPTSDDAPPAMELRRELAWALTRPAPATATMTAEKRILMIVV